MLPDHYATLGVAPHSSRALIRAAYVKLMRRYHPDRNSSPAAAARVRAVTSAYAVLGVPSRRARYDFERSQKTRAAGVSWFPRSRRRQQVTPWFATALPIVGLLLLLVLIPPPITDVERSLGATRMRGGERVVRKEQLGPVLRPIQAALCSSPAISEVLKRGLFRRAAQFRGNSQAAFEQLADHADLRFESPELTDGGGETEVVNCKSAITLYLPPGMASSGGRRTLTGTVDYRLRLTEGSARGTVSLTSVPPITELLATLAQASVQDSVADAFSNSHQRVVQNEASSDVQLTLALAEPVPVSLSTDTAPPQPGIPQPNPSFSCQAARSWAAVTVCNRTDLAALDRELASLYGDAMERAEASRRALLIRSDPEFLARRDGCTTASCIRSVYVTAIQELREIAED